MILTKRQEHWHSTRPEFAVVSVGDSRLRLAGGGDGQVALGHVRRYAVRSCR